MIGLLANGMLSSEEQKPPIGGKETIMSDSLLLQVQGILSVTPARWQHLAETLPEGLLTRQPLPGEWSARECLQHLLDTERFVFPVRVRAILAGQDFPAFDPEKEGSDYSKQTTLQLAEEFAKQRAGSLKLLEQVTAKDLACTGRHSELG